MGKYWDVLPQLSDDLFITDGGIETTLIYHEGLELPYFAAIDLMKNNSGEAALRKYFHAYTDVATEYDIGCVLESATWRASADWGEKLGFSSPEFAALNRRAITELREIRREHEHTKTRVVVSGCIGPRGDGYNPATFMTEAEAARYHAMQAEAFREAGADLVTGITMTYTAEAIGIARAAKAVDLPVVLSFTVETDGKLPTGQTLKDAIAQVDAATEASPAYYMINCAHPTHFAGALATGEPWLARIRGIRANASAKSHAELDQATELDTGNPQELARQYQELRDKLPNLNVVGGCCGTDHRHVDAICRAFLAH